MTEPAPFKMQPPEGYDLYDFHADTPHRYSAGCDVDPMCKPWIPPRQGSEDSESDAPSYDPPPKHYQGEGMDAWAVWDAFDLDRYTAAAVKYLLRAGKKDIAPRLGDLIKARNYVNKLIEMEEKRDN